MRILEGMIKVLRNKENSLVKILWRPYGTEKTTGEQEKENAKEIFFTFLEPWREFQGQNSLKEGAL